MLDAVQGRTWPPPMPRGPERRGLSLLAWRARALPARQNPEDMQRPGHLTALGGFITACKPTQQTPHRSRELKWPFFLSPTSARGQLPGVMWGHVGAGAHRSSSCISAGHQCLTGRGRCCCPEGKGTSGSLGDWCGLSMSSSRTGEVGEALRVEDRGEGGPKCLKMCWIFHAEPSPPSPHSSPAGEG